MTSQSGWNVGLARLASLALAGLIAGCGPGAREGSPARSAPEAGDTNPAAQPPAPKARLRVTYIANEGVLIASGDTEVMIDGLQRGRPDMPYDVVAEPERGQLENAQARWSGVDLLLVSHRHDDHYHPEAVGKFLRGSAGATLVTSREVVDKIDRSVTAQPEMAGRVRGLVWTPGRAETITAGGVTVTFLGLSHGTGRVATVQNFGHLVELGGRKVLHLGDSDARPENFAVFDLPRRRIDIALVPWWYLETPEGLDVIRNRIAADKLVFFHIADIELPRARELVARHAPDATIFSTQLADHVEIDAVAGS
jgi:L-ascorbate metabolism protein UlaG (beta-lactamase superfamily)